MSVGEPQRSQYLDAMGLSVWVSRYCLPNARPSAQCKWQGDAPPPPRPPAQRLQALLAEQTPAEAVAPPPAATEPAAGSAPRRARALLAEEETATPAPEPAPQSAAPVPENDEKPREALRFSLQVAALDGRWLVLLPGRQAPQAIHQRLLGNLLRAAGIESGTAPQFQAFDWPMMEGQPVDAPLDEARDGLRAFVEGRRRRGWRPERLLLFGADTTLEKVLELQEGHCRLLDLPGWQGPDLSTLAQSAPAKRQLLPWLAPWRRAWHEGSSEQTE